MFEMPGQARLLDAFDFVRGTGEADMDMSGMAVGVTHESEVGSPPTGPLDQIVEFVGRRASSSRGPDKPALTAVVQENSNDSPRAGKCFDQFPGCHPVDPMWSRRQALGDCFTQGEPDVEVTT